MGAPRAGDMVTTQVSLGGFDAIVRARDLADFLELEAGPVWRCRVKTNTYPQDADPDFLLPAAASPRRSNARLPAKTLSSTSATGGGHADAASDELILRKL
ncbi:hypothetical protein ZWY2020_027136 [Hordeum vulgare]|nr:hypothetical protein ZWY2020_027136 [Hordeum vulgare]